MLKSFSELAQMTHRGGCRGKNLHLFSEWFPLISSVKTIKCYPLKKELNTGLWVVLVQSGWSSELDGSLLCKNPASVITIAQVTKKIWRQILSIFHFDQFNFIFQTLLFTLLQMSPLATSIQPTGHRHRFSTSTGYAYLSLANPFIKKVAIWR